MLSGDLISVCAPILPLTEIIFLLLLADMEPDCEVSDGQCHQPFPVVSSLLLISSPPWSTGIFIFISLPPVKFAIGKSLGPFFSP